MNQPTMTMAQQRVFAAAEAEAKAARAEIEFLGRTWRFGVDTSGKHLTAQWVGGGSPSRADEERMERSSDRILRHFVQFPEDYRRLTGRDLTPAEVASIGPDYSRMTRSEIAALAEKTDPRHQR